LINLGLTERGGRIVVSSRDIARVFEKEHDKVIRDIASLNCSAEFSTANFGESEYVSDRGRTYREYLLTRDGFTILAMGYTGEKAMQFKEAYIAAFNEMERKLQSTPSISDLVNNPQLLLSLLTKHIEVQQENARLQITAAKYEGQTDAVGLYKVGEIAEELGTTAIKLNRFLKDCRVQYKPNGSQTWRLYKDYIGENLAFPKIVTLNNGYDMPMLLWTPKGRDFIFDLAERELPAWYA
jgi:Rha family phage regulatory protein